MRSNALVVNRRRVNTNLIQITDTVLSPLNMSLYLTFKLTISNPQKMKFSVNDFFIKCWQITRKKQIRSHLRKKFVTQNLFFVESTWSFSLSRLWIRVGNHLNGLSCIYKYQGFHKKKNFVNTFAFLTFGCYHFFSDIFAHLHYCKNREKNKSNPLEFYLKKAPIIM